jgi:aspartate racemase
MKTVGLIGGMSWESSLHYYKILNEEVKGRLGGHNSCKCLMYSVNFAEIEKLQHEGKWDKLTEIMISAAKNVQRGGADFLVICTNTMHKMADEIERNVGIPVLHIADATAQSIKGEKINRVGLLGTKFTMEQDFYKGRIFEKYGIEVIIPDEQERQMVHDIIYNELVHGVIKASSRNTYLQVISNLANKGAQGIVLGCTEIPLLVNQQDCEVKLFDTTAIHALAAVELALK